MSVVGRRGRALAGTLLQACVGALTPPRVGDYWPAGPVRLGRPREEGGKAGGMPARHTLDERLGACLAAGGCGLPSRPANRGARPMKNLSNPHQETNR